MTLPIGSRLGPYEILSALGAGGMGEVYRARDSKLNRDVALKVLPDSFANDPERLARFEREAQLLASLNHPHIAHIYGLEEAHGTRALVMELVEGPTLADVIEQRQAPGFRLRTPGLMGVPRGAGTGQETGARSPKPDTAPRQVLPLDEALPIARQIAEALEAAHEQGIIHRDLKPANIKLKVRGAPPPRTEDIFMSRGDPTPARAAGARLERRLSAADVADCTVKVLDFGLAKALDPTPGSGAAGDLSQSPTITSPAMMTGVGVILGTAAYMSPEQAKGRTADKRSDIWAFGCVVYEMLTGKRAFDGEDMTDVLGAVARLDPDWSALPAEIPPAIRTLLQSCLTKDRRHRVADISTALFVLDKAASLASGTPAAGPAEGRRDFRTTWRRVGLFTAAALIVGAVVTGTAVWFAMHPAPPRVTRLTITPAATAAFTLDGVARDLAIAPDGTRVVYAGGTPPSLFVRALDQLAPTALSGLGALPRHPVFSHDGQWIAFFDGSTSLKKVAVTGGSAVMLAQIGDSPRGASWGANDTITFATIESSTGLLRVGAAGGKPEVLTRPDRAAGEIDHVWPEVLPGDAGVLFTILTAGGIAQAQVAVLDERTGSRKVLIRGGSHAQYVTPGYLVYGAVGTLRAVPFDLERLEVVGPPVPVVDGVVTTSQGAVDASVATDGTLVYVAGGSATIQRSLVWVDRQGREQAVGAPPRAYVFPRLSPDGTEVAVFSADQEEDIWLWNAGRQSGSRMTFDAARDFYPVWTPDGRRLVWSSQRTGPPNLYWQAADGTGAVERVTDSPNSQNPTSITPDGTRVVLHETRPATGLDLMLLTLGGSGAVTPLLATPFAERNGEVSPDGRWLAYESDESGQTEIYVRPFPDVEAGKWQVSTAGATRPLWARSGKELFFRALDGAVLAAAVTVDGARIRTGTPATRVESGYFVGGAFLGRTYDVSPDGERFLLIKEGDGARDTAAQAPSIVVVQHWVEELKRLVAPPGR